MLKAFQWSAPNFDQLCDPITVYLFIFFRFRVNNNWRIELKSIIYGYKRDKGQNFQSLIGRQTMDLCPLFRLVWAWWKTVGLSWIRYTKARHPSKLAVFVKNSQEIRQRKTRDRKRTGFIWIFNVFFSSLMARRQPVTTGQLGTDRYNR